MAKLRLTLACWNYDRTRALLEERISVDGIELNYLNLVVEETFFRMLRHREFDVAEMSLSSYTISLFGEDRPFIAIPVFPSRSFASGEIDALYATRAPSTFKTAPNKVRRLFENYQAAEREYFQKTKIFPIM